MPLQEQKKFVGDSQNNLTVRQRNKELGAALMIAPLVSKKIFKIDRVEIGAKGWFVHYRTGTP